MAKKVILSGMRPTGPLHLGNLVGALQNWVRFQDEYKCYYFIADWHALMSEYKDSSGIREYSYEVLAEWLAAGIDPERSTVFIQSDVYEHLELYMVFSIVTPVSWLERCPTYKEQMRELKEKDVTNYAFLGYPALQAADILMYKADKVPVGDDQLPHLEVTREIARRFNSLFGPVFGEPQALLTEAPRLLGLDRRKMSKSYGNTIALSDEDDAVRKKVSTMITDPQRVKKTDPGRPDYCNVCHYYKVFAPGRVGEVADRCSGAKWGCTDCKKELAEELIKVVAPIRAKRNELLADRPALEKIIAKGNAEAKAVASRTMREVREKVGMVDRR